MAAVLLGLAAPVPAGATSLAPFIDLQEKGLTTVDAGTGLEGLGAGTANLTVDVGGPVRFALLYWAGRDRPCAAMPCGIVQPYKDQQLVFNGTSLTGTIIGTEEQPATEAGATNNIGYFADVTSIVSAAGPGAHAFTVKDGNLASNLFRLDGASLIVGFTDTASTVTYRVLLWDGLDFAFGNDLTPGPARVTTPVTFAHGGKPFPRTGALTIVAGDATAAGADRLAISNQADVQNCLDGSSGSRWDSETLTIGLPASSATTTTQVFSDPGTNPDSLLWLAAMLRVPVDAAEVSAGNGCLPAPAPPPLLSVPVDLAPQLSNLRVKPKAFGVAKPSGAKKSAASPTISYTASEAAKVTFEVERVTKGSRVGGACVKRTAANEKRKPCPRFAPVAGSFSQDAKAGPNSRLFSGRLGKVTLSSGPYRLTATAVDPAGTARLPPARASGSSPARRPGRRTRLSRSRSPRTLDGEMTEDYWTVYESPLGPLTLVAGPKGLRGLSFPGRLRVPGEAARRPLPEIVGQLEAYFAGERRAFDLPLDLRGTPLQKEVWRRLLEIPYGTTTSYGELAGRVDPSLFPPEVEPWQRARVVGATNGRNPIAIVVPCHRVIGADGSLTGYGGGLRRKQALLDLERERQLAIL